MAVPIAAIDKVVYASYTLPHNKKDDEQVTFMKYQLEIILKEDFLDFYLRADYDQRVATAFLQNSKTTHNHGHSILTGLPTV